ncbi:hypothetical protein RA224_21880 [Achromobacter aegrifaciens]|uniref:hypothetical protein n=1 Tax=Achromobacter aegrifaciens TaxID=1287736 RepID=UPI0027B9FCD0|nr:hypothetical protein [Achromobacter aegrifaciens]WLW59869.1 hypothetical protein RA224_21880 [Achromobacter aegrifaciens]
MTDAEIQALWDEACKDSPQNPGWNRHVRFARALLSKLRAPVADERAALVWYAEQVAGCRKFGPDGEGARNALDKDGGERARAALASAPLAGEAKSPDRAMLEAVMNDLNVSDWNCPRCGHAEECSTMDAALMLRDYLAAPQASEAVRDAAINDVISILLNLSARYRHNYDKEGCNSYHEGGADALDEAEQAIRAALSAQPGAQKEQSDA